MSAERTSVAGASYRSFLDSLAPGDYFVDYSDRAHLNADSWVRLVQINIPEGLHSSGEEGDYESFFTIKLLVSSLDARLTLGERETHIIADQLAQSMVRLGILRPALTFESASDLYNLSRREALVIIPDTNALANGTLHWLLQSFTRTTIWLLPMVVSLTQIQQQDGMLKGLSRKSSHSALSYNDLRGSLRARTLVNASFSLLERCGARYQVLEVDPQLLRYVRPSGKGSSDPDDTDVLEDRLLIETIHSVLEATRSRTEKRVLTSDVLLARMLHAEAIPYVLLQVPLLRQFDQIVPSIRYEPFAEGFQGAPLSHFLWDLTHSFGTIRLSSAPSTPRLKLDLYWPEKTASDWINEALTMSLTGAVEAGGSGSAAGRTNVGVFSKSLVPEASLVQVLRVAGALLDEDSDVEGILHRFDSKEQPSSTTVRMALEILLRTGLIVGDERLVSATWQLKELGRKLKDGDLDAVSAFLESFSPYGELLSVLRVNEAIHFAQASRELRKQVGSASKDAFERLVRFPVYLGQAWTDESLIRDGTRRLSDDKVRQEFLGAFNRVSTDRLAPLSALIPTMSRALRVSPWRLRLQLQKLVEGGGLAQFSFEPAVGKKAAPRDQVISGSLGSITAEPVPLDRLLIAGRPVFTVERRD